MKLTDERLIEIIKTHPESDEREAMAVELRQLRAEVERLRALLAPGLSPTLSV